MTRSRIPRRLLPASLLAILALTAGGTANAYWGGSGGGSGSATTGTTLAVTVSPGTPTTFLYPGGQAGVALTVSNPNTFPVRIGTLALDPGPAPGGFAVDPVHLAAGCTAPAATLSFPTQTNGVTGWPVPASSSLPVTLTGALGMGLGAASACQGATFTVYLAAGP